MRAAAIACAAAFALVPTQATLAQEHRCPVTRSGVAATISGTYVSITNNASECRYVATAVYRLYAYGVPQQKSFYSNIFQLAPGERKTFQNIPVPNCAYVIYVVAGNAILDGPVTYGDRVVSEYSRTNTFFCSASDTSVMPYQALPIPGLLPAGQPAATPTGSHQTGSTPYTPGAISYTYPDPNYQPLPSPRASAQPPTTPSPLPSPQVLGASATPTSTGPLSASTGSTDGAALAALAVSAVFSAAAFGFLRRKAVSASSAKGADDFRIIA